MITLEIFLFGLLAVSLLTSLTTEAIKKFLTERKMNDDLTFSKREHINVDHV